MSPQRTTCACQPADRSTRAAFCTRESTTVTGAVAVRRRGPPRPRWRCRAAAPSPIAAVARGCTLGEQPQADAVEIAEHRHDRRLAGQDRQQLVDRLEGAAAGGPGEREVVGDLVAGEHRQAGRASRGR